eukprot:Tbor_TRINITY_DN1998_c0_g1::TRINITY_DN1998_c0_g1_i1::g.3479::m.3479
MQRAGCTSLALDTAATTRPQNDPSIHFDGINAKRLVQDVSALLNTLQLEEQHLKSALKHADVTGFSDMNRFSVATTIIDQIDYVLESTEHCQQEAPSTLISLQKARVDIRLGLKRIEACQKRRQLLRDKTTESERVCNKSSISTSVPSRARQRVSDEEAVALESLVRTRQALSKELDKVNDAVSQVASGTLQLRRVRETLITSDSVLGRAQGAVSKLLTVQLTDDILFYISLGVFWFVVMYIVVYRIFGYNIGYIIYL